MEKAKSVDEYISREPEIVQEKLKQFRSIVKEIAPMAEERISYGMPGYFYKGALVYFGGFKNHVSLFGTASGVIKKFAKELKGYKMSKGTIQFPLDKPLPVGLIKRIVQERVSENEIKRKSLA